MFEGKAVGKVSADLVVNDTVVVVIRSVGQLTSAHDAAVRAYLDRLEGVKTGKHVGLLVNFMRDPLESRKVTRVTAQLAEANVYRVAEVLTAVGNETSVEPLCAAIADPIRDAQLRLSALDAILSIAGRMEDVGEYKPAILKAIASALSSKPVDEEATDAELADHAKVRSHAAKTAAALKWPEAKPMLEKALAAEENEDVQKAIKEALEKLEQEKGNG